MGKRLLLLTIILLFSQITVVFSQITIGTVDPGPYGYGSNVTVPINFTDNQSEFNVGNVFTLYLSDASGNFVGNGTSIGTYNGFYTPFINGLIPGVVAASSNYKLQIKSSNPARTIVLPGTIDIRNLAAAPVTLTPNLPANALGGDNLGWCPVNAGNGKSISLKSNATTPTVVKVTLKNLISGATTNYSEDPDLGFDITGIDLGYYTITATATSVVNGVNIQSTKTYFLHNTQLTVNIQDIGKNIGCFSAIGGGAPVEYQIKLIDGISNNYPGSTYIVNWGDGSLTQTLTIKQIADNAARISHSYNKTSCAEPDIPGPPIISHSFKATITATNPICNLSNSATAYAQVFENPVARITPASSSGCVNEVIRFTNASVGGTRSDCTTDMDYTWYVDGVKKAEYSTRAPFDWKFTTKGPHTVKLVASNGVGTCQPSEFTANICIQEPPKPAFDFNGITGAGCAPFSIKANDRSVVDANCNNNNTYNWIVTKSGRTVLPTEVTFTNGVPEPTFTFLKQGTYEVTLQINTVSCGAVSTSNPQTIVIIDSAPRTILTSPATICGLGTYTYNDQAASPFQVIFSGTERDAPDTYTWMVTAADGSPLNSADYSFTNGTNITKYPTIKFNQYGTYKVSVVHKNSCDQITTAQLITFKEAPILSITAPSICYNAKANITGSISNNNYISHTWSTLPGGGTFANSSTLSPIYTPSAADVIARKATVILTVNTGLGGDCELISINKEITIHPNNTSTSTTQTICTGTAAKLILTSVVPGSTYSWTAINRDGNASGFTTFGTTDINQVINNTSLTQNAVIIYTITPSANGCTGSNFTYTVTVTPRPKIDPVLDKTICHNNSADITVRSNIPTQFTWTFTASTGITVNTKPPTLTGSNQITINDELLNSTFAPETVTYTITPQSNSVTGCEGDPIIVNVTVDPKVTTATAGANRSICNKTTYDLEGSEPKVGTGVWDLVSATAGTPPITIATPNNFKTTVTGLVAGGVYTFRWTITGAGKCAKSEAQVTITVNMPTVPGTTTGNPAIVCANTNTGTITLSGHTGSILKWQILPENQAVWKDLDGINIGSTYTFTNLSVTTQFRAVVQNAECNPEYSTPTTITVAPASTIAEIVDEQITLCDERSVSLKGNVIKPGETGTWTMISGDGNALITTGLDSKATVTGLLSGITYIFRWTITGNSPCGETYDEIKIINNNPISQSISSTIAVACFGQQVNITGGATTGGDGNYTYAWESKTDAGQWTPFSPAETAKDLSIYLTTEGNISFRRIVNSGGCTSPSNSYTIRVNPKIENNKIEGDQTICSGKTPALLTGSIPTGGDGDLKYQWQSSFDGTNWINIPGALGTNYQPSAPLNVPTYYRRNVWTSACSGSLQNSSNPVKITITPNAKAEFTWGDKDKDCFPFTLPIVVVPHDDINATYTWRANGVILPSTGSAFPGFTIQNSNERVTINLEVTSSLGCSKDDFEWTFSTNQAVPASFDLSVTEGCGPLPVNLINTSNLTAGAKFEWYSGDELISKEIQPPTITLASDPTGKDSTYVITLKSITSCGPSSITKTVFVKAKPIAVFTPDKVEVCSPYKITFTNTSPGSTNTYYYDFDDGSPIIEKHDKSDVEHIFDVAVTTEFTVKMTAKNDCGEDVKEWTIRVFPKNMTPVLGVKLEEIKGCAPHTVNFENNSIGASKFVFDFGDGSPTRTTFTTGIVSYTYKTSGKFTVTMTAFNICSEIPVTKNVEVLAQPVADFQAENTLGCPGLVVEFKNNTEGGLNNSYVWDFGDGSPVSNDFQPTHTYTGAQEYYTVKLLATNQLGCPIEVIKTQFIHIVQPPVAAFNVNPSTLINIPDYTFHFQDESTNNPTIWHWDFGDKVGTSALKNPSYTYLDTGTYKVTLRVENQHSCFTTTFKNVTIKGVPGYLSVPNSFIPGDTRPELREFRAKGSGIQTWRFSVFNKWGQILWETTNLTEGRPTEGWDGTFKGQPLPQGVYYWKIDVQMVNGSEWKGMTYDKSAPKRTGAIHLIR